MLISLNPNQFFDLAGKPLAGGRISVFLHGSDTLANTYVMDGTSFIEGPNPCILDDAGEMPSTLFMEAAIYDIRVEKNVDGNYATISDFQFGFNPASASNDTIVNGMQGLADANPELGKVTVVGYDEFCQCGQRTYIWDPTCTENTDGGCIIGSNVEPSGRWLLLSDLREMPCTYYGITPSRVANVSAFLTYQQTVGQWGIYMPPVPRFISGTYSSTGTFSTTKVISFDSDARFPGAAFVCPRVEITNNSNNVAEFLFTADNVEAHSSWFRSITQFLECGADTFIVDGTNWFTDNNVSYPIEITNKTLFYAENTRLPITYVNTGRLKLSNVNIVGTRIFNNTDLITFSYTDFKQDWFTTTQNSWDFNTKVIVRTSSLNTLRIENFKDVAVYVKAMEANGATSINLAGRHIPSLQTSQITEFTDVDADTMSIMVPGQVVEFHNVKVEELYMNAQQLVAEDSDFVFGAEPTLIGLTAYNCDMGSAVPWIDQSISVTAEDCHVGISFTRAPDNTSKDNALLFIGCTLTHNAVFYSKNMSFHKCTSDNNGIKFYPYQENGVYKMDVTLEDNCFTGAYPVEFTKVSDDNCYMVQANWEVVGNQFLGNANGIVCRYWQNRTGQNYDKVFIDISTNSSILYDGNYGNCPKQSMKGARINMNSTPYATVETSSGSGQYIYVYTYANERVCPVPHLAPTSDANQLLYNVDTPDGNEYKVSHGSDLDLKVASSVRYWSKGSMANDNDGDLFQLGLCSWVVDPGNDALAVI